MGIFNISIFSNCKSKKSTKVESINDPKTPKDTVTNNVKPSEEINNHIPPTEFLGLPPRQGTCFYNDDDLV